MRTDAAHEIGAGWTLAFGYVLPAVAVLACMALLWWVGKQMNRRTDADGFAEDFIPIAADVDTSVEFPADRIRSAHP